MRAGQVVSTDQRVEYANSVERADRASEQQPGYRTQQSLVHERRLPSADECLRSCCMGRFEVDPTCDRADQFPDVQRAQG
jgi:hypothetical protein